MCFWLETNILGNAFLGALTLPCYGHIPPRQCPHLRTHSKNVPLSLTRFTGDLQIQSRASLFSARSESNPVLILPLRNRIKTYQMTDLSDLPTRAYYQSWKIHSILPIHTCIYSYLYKYLYNTCILYQLDITDCAYMQTSALYGALHTCMMRAIIVDLYCIFSQLSHTCI